MNMTPAPSDPLQRSRREAKPASSGKEKLVDTIELIRPNTANAKPAVVGTSARPIDPIEAFGLELGRLINERNAIEEVQRNDRAPCATNRLEYIEARIDAREDMIATTKATSLVGALMQAYLISGLVNIVARGTNESGRERAESQIGLLVYSIIAAIETATGRNSQEFGGGYYTLPDFDPFNPADERALSQPSAGAGRLAGAT
jgi:hypothetical protein